MPHLTDRKDRTILISLYDASGGRTELSGARLNTALRVKRNLSRAMRPEGGAAGREYALCERAIIKILGLRPVRAGIKFWNGRAITLGAPADTANFLSDLNGIIKENQYNFEDFKNAVVIDAGAKRFRPMLLTAAAVVVGASVILFDPIFQGLAISLMAGEIASLLLSRMAVPVIYYMAQRQTSGDGAGVV